MSKKFKQLINPHSHTHYSLDGAATVKQIIKRNQELGANYVAVTEHGNMNSAAELYSLSLSGGFKPILGIEAYLVNPFHNEYVELYRKALKEGKITVRAKDPEKIEKALQDKAMKHYMHVTIHFRDAWAYRYFSGLSEAMYSRAVNKYGELKPMITLEELEGASGHITVTSSCLKGPVQLFMVPSRDGVIQPDPKRAEYMYLKLKEIAGGDNFYVEVFPHMVTHDWQRPKTDADGNILEPGKFIQNECTCHAPGGDIQKIPNQFVYNLSKKYKDPAIISLDSHFAWPRQKLVQDCKLSNGRDAWKFYESYHILSTDEAADRLKVILDINDRDIEEMVDNSYKFGSRFDDFKLETKKDRFVMQTAEDNWLPKLMDSINKYGRMDWTNNVMKERLQKEISILANNGKVNLMPYFFTVEDVADFCRKNDILMNVRGSAGGSLLLYLLGVSSVNPLDHGLSFERFLTKGRILSNSMPDADIDISNQDMIFQYLEQKYGKSFCRLSTDSMLKLKSSIKDVERANLGAVRKTTEDMCKRLPGTPQGSDDIEFVFGKMDDDGNRHGGIFETHQELVNYAKENEKLWLQVVEMMGIMRQKSVHACGAVIADRNIEYYMPVMWINDTKVTGFSPKGVEDLGLIKYDFLQLNTLRDIRGCLKSIKSRLGVDLDPWKLPHDPKCFDLFAEGRTETVFQFDTETVRPYLAKIRPKSIDDLAAITALCRPGTLDAPSDDGRTLAQVYVARATGEPVEYLHPDLEPILKETFGIQIYQEQTLNIFKKIGGLSDEQAEDARRGIGKKDAKLLAQILTGLKETCIKKGWSECQAQLLCDQIIASSKYSFNKSHACSYSYVAYACMYLKTHYPLDWWKSMLSNADKDEIVTKWWQYIQDFTVLPDINLSKKTFEIMGDKIVAPISILTGVGPKAYEALVSGGPYQSLKDFVVKHCSKREKGDRNPINGPMIEKLVAGGVLDSLFALEYPEATDIEKKLSIYQELKNEVRNEWGEPVNPIYIGITDLGRYLVQKQLVPLYSIDLRPILLKNRGGWVSGNTCYVKSPETPNLPVLDGNQIEYIKKRVEAKIDLPKDKDCRYYGAIAYVVGEKTWDYKQKTKTATKITIDINGYFFEEVIWPAWEESTAPNGFKNLPVLVVYKESARGLSISRIQPLLHKDEIKKYNFVV
jgi:DNA polymerase-3 subunit alpha